MSSRCPLATLYCVTVALILVTGCPSTRAAQRYGPERDATVSTRPKSGELPAAAAPGTEPRNLPSPLHFYGTVDEAVADAAASEGRQKILVFFTDGGCADCLRYEAEYFVAPEVRQELEGRWLIVKSDARSDRSVRDSYRLTDADVPLLIVVSEEGNENARIATLPSTPAAFARLLNDEF